MRYLLSDTEIGTVLTTVTANDVDTNPVLTYAFVNDDDTMDASMSKFLALDRFSGKIVLKQKFDYEEKYEYQVKIIASDAIVSHTAETILTIRIIDQNDNAPVFTDVAYFTAISGTIKRDSRDKGTVFFINSHSIPQPN